MSSLLIASLIAGCGGDKPEENGSGGAGGSGGDGGGSGGMGGVGGVGGSGGSSADAVTGTAIDTFSTAAGDVKAPAKPTKWTSLEALVEQGGTFTSYPGSIDANGAVLIPNVPQGPYWLAVTEPPPPGVPGAPGLKIFVETSSRTLDLGTLYSHRMDIEPITAPTFLKVSASLTQPFQVYTQDDEGHVLQELSDTLQIISYGANVSGVAYGDSGGLGGAPADGAMSFNQWTLDASTDFYGIDGRPYLIRTDKKDDLALLHNVTSRVEAPAPPATPDPWALYDYEATKAVFRPAAAVMTNGATTPVNGSFEAVQQSTFSFNYKGSLFTKALEDAPSADLFDASTSFSVYHEPGAPIPAAGGVSTLLGLYVPAIKTWVDPMCNPDACDPAACASGCSDAETIFFPGDHTHDFAYGNPYTSGQEIANVVFSFRSDVTQLLPSGQTLERLQGRITIHRPAGQASGAPFAPVVGLPRNVKVNGNPAPVDQLTAGVGTTPDISFDPPSLGTPAGYSVRIIALDDINGAGGAVLSRRQTVATFSFTGTSLKVPGGLLQAGKHYYFQVTATEKPRDPVAPFRLDAQNATAMTHTGVITP
ncbi:MAG TPA: hypothetical protein VE093_29230 [Polyangiaceae bacterium]|nr:hypothetical protein [Polyangiaceae bacterium]